MSLTIFTTYLNDLLHKDIYLQVDIILLQGRLEKIENLRLDFDNIQIDIELPQDIDYPLHFNERINFETNFNNITVQSNCLVFRDIFQSLIHGNEMVTSMQKYHYLKVSLERSAAQIIKAVGFFTTGYTLAWEDAFCERYNKKRTSGSQSCKSLISP